MSNSDNRTALRAYVSALGTPNFNRYSKAVGQFFAPDADINICHPFNEISGGAGYIAKFLQPLMQSFEQLHRTDYIAMAGSFEGAEWVTTTGYYVGHFTSPWLGIKPSGALAYLRFGEFHRMQDGQAVESYVYLDIPELMIACGQWPITSSPGVNRGYTGFLPGPASLDGLQWKDTDSERSESSYQMVTKMLQGLATADEAWRPYWHENMMWYGPAAFGSFVGIENFAGFQVPFEQTFSEWIGGSVKGSQTKHFTRFGDGDYVCSGGWPSLNCVQIKPFLDQEPAGKRLYMRVCDWWRREGDLLRDNWVFVDIPHVLLQMGYDLFGDLEKRS